MIDIVRTENLTKHFAEVRAVTDLSLSIKPGEIYGFLGLNGAGKTTTIRMFLGLISPSSGTCFIFDKKVRPGNHEIWEKVGYLVEIPYSYPDLTVRENLEIIRRLRFIKNRKSVDTVIDRLHLGEYSARKVRNLSQGNAQRLGLAKALLHNPQVLLLDEPSNGLDPAGIVELRELFHDLAVNHGVTIFISSHILDEISKIATRIGIIHEGRLIQELDAVRLDQLLQQKLIISTLNNDSAATVLAKNGYSANLTETDTLEITSENTLRHPEEIVKILVYAGFPPILIKVEQEDLESYFLRTIAMK